MVEFASDQETPQFEEILDQELEAFSNELRVCLPGRIEKYDVATHLASIRPLLKRRQFGRDAVSLPLIRRVPVIHPRTGTAMIRLPVKAGDICTLVFADWALRNWIGGDGAEKDPQDTRAHHISDAYAIPGGYPEKASAGGLRPGDNPDALEIQVAPGTKVAVGNGTVELLDILDNIIDEIDGLYDHLKSAYTVLGNLGSPTAPDPAQVAFFTTFKATLATIKTNLGALKL